MKKVALYGAGGLGREVALMIEKINKEHLGQWDFIGFFDDGKKKGEQVDRLGYVLGGINELNKWPEELCVALCFGSPSTLLSIRNKISNPKINFPNLVDPSFYVGDPHSFKIGYGNIIRGGCTGTICLTIGSFNILNGYISMGHDVTVGDYNVIMPHVAISGSVSIGDVNLIGVGSIIIQGIKIGNMVTLGAGSVLMKKTKDESLYLGNPAKLFKF